MTQQFPARGALALAALALGIVSSPAALAGGTPAGQNSGVTTSAVVRVQLKVTAPPSQNSSTFSTQFSTELSRALGISINRIAIISVTAG